jgi:hypothetical protein
LRRQNCSHRLSLRSRKRRPNLIKLLESMHPLAAAGEMYFDPFCCFKFVTSEISQNYLSFFATIRPKWRSCVKKTKTKNKHNHARAHGRSRRHTLTQQQQLQQTKHICFQSIWFVTSKLSLPHFCDEIIIYYFLVD